MTSDYTLFWFQERLHFKFPAAALLITNGLMLTAPFQALAGTCEAENSLLNMPLLLFVAIVGATVGGKFIEHVIHLFHYLH